jgi:hypothetical protein
MAAPPRSGGRRAQTVAVPSSLHDAMAAKLSD